MSTKEWTIVALQDDDIGQPRDVIRFLDHRDNPAANIAAPATQADDGVVTNIRNQGIVTKTRMRRPRIALDFSRLRWQDALRLRQLESQDRRVYFCPNVEENTIWCQPLLGNYTEFLRDETAFKPLSSLDTFGWQWDEERQTFYAQTAWIQSRNGASPFMLDSPYGIASRPSLKTFTNRASKPLPDSTATGWSVTTGGGTITYENEIRLPVTSDPDTSSSSGGITHIESDGATGGSFAASHSASGLAADADICAAVLVRAIDSSWVVQLKDHSGTQIDSTSFAADKRWRLIRLQGAQSAGGTTATVSVFNTSGDTRKTSIQVATVFIADMPEDMSGEAGPWPFPDFVEDEQDALLYNRSEGPQLSAGWTISIAVQHKDRTYPILYLGTPNDSIWVRRVDPNDWIAVTVGASNTDGNTTELTLTDAGIEDGDWYMLTIVSDLLGIYTYLNGQIASATPPASGIADVGLMDDTKQIGYAGTARRWSEDQGLMLYRIDNEPWDADRVLRHYNTYLAAGGVAYVAPMIGWECRIAGLDWEPYNMDDGSLVVNGSIELEGLRATPEFRTLHPDLTSNNDG